MKSDGRCLDVEVVARDSSKVAEALAGGGPPGFQVWLPDSDLWLDRAEGLGTGVPVSPSDSIASSPVVVAMVPSASGRLGWPEKTYSWAELVATAIGTERIRLGAADPARSATGLLALTSIGGSSARQGGDSDTRVAETAKVLADPERPVPVIAIAVGPDADRAEVAEIARITGGDGYEVSDPAEIQAVIFQAIMAAGQNGRAAQE